MRQLIIIYGLKNTRNKCVKEKNIKLCKPLLEFQLFDGFDFPGHMMFVPDFMHKACDGVVHGVAVLQYPAQF